MTVHRVWQRASLQPHRLERYVASPDPDLGDEGGGHDRPLPHPPAHAEVFCVDEETAIQVLDRRDPILPLSPRRAVRHGFEYVRHALSLYTALAVGTGHVERMTAARHTGQDLLTSLDRVCATQSKRREINLIQDNLSAYKTNVVTAWIEGHPRVHLYFPPTYSSWLSQVELLAKIERDCIARGIFTSTADFPSLPI